MLFILRLSGLMLVLYIYANLITIRYLCVVFRETLREAPDVLLSNLNFYLSSLLIIHQIPAEILFALIVVTLFGPTGQHCHRECVMITLAFN